MMLRLSRQSSATLPLLPRPRCTCSAIGSTRLPFPGVAVRVTVRNCVFDALFRRFHPYLASASLSEKRPRPALRIGVVTCAADLRSADLFFPGRCPPPDRRGGAVVLLAEPGKEDVGGEAPRTVNLGGIFNEGVAYAYATLAQHLGWPRKEEHYVS